MKREHSESFISDAKVPYVQSQQLLRTAELSNGSFTSTMQSKQTETEKKEQKEIKLVDSTSLTGQNFLE